MEGFLACPFGTVPDKCIIQASEVNHSTGHIIHGSQKHEEIKNWAVNV